VRDSFDLHPGEVQASLDQRRPGRAGTWPGVSAEDSEDSECGGPQVVSLVPADVILPLEGACGPGWLPGSPPAPPRSPPAAGPLPASLPPLQQKRLVAAGLACGGRGCRRVARCGVAAAALPAPLPPLQQKRVVAVGLASGGRGCHEAVRGVGPAVRRRRFGRSAGSADTGRVVNGKPPLSGGTPLSGDTPRRSRLNRRHSSSVCQASYQYHLLVSDRSCRVAGWPAPVRRPAGRAGGHGRRRRISLCFLWCPCSDAILIEKVAVEVVVMGLRINNLLV
jgi:hypothetical protein